MGNFKKTEYNPIFKVYTEDFLIARIPHFTVLITEAEAQRCSQKFRKINRKTPAPELLF